MKTFSQMDPTERLMKLAADAKNTAQESTINITHNGTLEVGLDSKNAAAIEELLDSKVGTKHRLGAELFGARYNEKTQKLSIRVKDMARAAGGMKNVLNKEITIDGKTKTIAQLAEAR